MTPAGTIVWFLVCLSIGHPSLAQHPPSKQIDSLEAILPSLQGKARIKFTDHTYDYLGWAPRTFPSIIAIGLDAGNSRLYAGIHYQPSIDRGLIQGNKVADNIFGRILRFTPKSDD
jgi:hypothetical protein